MYTVDRAAAAVLSLVTHCRLLATDLHVFDLHISRSAVQHIVAGCSTRKNRKPKLQLRYNRIRVIMNCVITSFQDQLSVCRSKKFCESTSGNGHFRGPHIHQVTLTHSLHPTAFLAGHGVTVSHCTRSRYPATARQFAPKWDAQKHAETTCVKPTPPVPYKKKRKVRFYVKVEPKPNTFLKPVTVAPLLNVDNNYKGLFVFKLTWIL